MSVICFILFLVIVPIQLNAQSSGDDVFTVVIDAGHGGKDPGAVGKKSYEKNIALAIAKKAGYYIESLIDDVRVIYTRKTDVFVDLDVRADIANRNNADLFISIHINSIPSGRASGTMTFVMGVTKNDNNLQLVKAENEVILLEDDYTAKYKGYDPNSTVSKIFFSTMQWAYQNQSLEFASKMQDQFRTKAKRRDRGVHAGGLLVLWKTTMPSVLVECGFISDAEEEAFLMTDYGQDLIASGIYRAFRDYKKEIDDRTTNEIVIADEISLSEEVTNDAAVSEKKPVAEKKTESAKKVQISYSKPDLHFRVQLLATQKEIASSARELKGYTNYEMLRLDGYYKYMTKSVSSYSQALNLRKQILSKFPGAFIVGFKSGKKIPLTQAIEEDKKIH
ncbi:MAG: N-acetylmuramoyl-L-alanine amidase [Bacteroidetes bacterium]|jgi:N-acetylmuramoyl-L-alanine amidase|nr:N-acetylmuramoyl-L-alanine amidase [Bacteroidota bacterium]MBT4399328.1 N-acetylmuramoyl-L-alanine amidase [Bacteroidota bacterium]MBT4410807.1 N-acetylmuramoyl-L-alanine amidase [Bacteroidota bacterium]MBT5427464.1 N-acetylmuramoyl-L-alanine amidase [Bacteroidota bacterium]MBT7093943.1 N-acetylmuramoyl-L-alanine amidase [Bacteroidota bacterium]